MRKVAIAYPAVKRAAAEYLLHSKTIPEPYVALEDPAGEECKQFVTNQNALFESYLGDSQEVRRVLFDKIQELQNYPRHSTVSNRNNRFYYYFNSGLQNQSILMRSKTISGEDAEVFMDPNALSAEGTTALKAASWNESETQWAYSVSEKGSDWQSIHVRDGETKTDLEDKVDWVKFSGITWLKDVGFFYTRYPELAEGQEKGAETDAAMDAAIYFHKVGTPQSSDVFVVNDPTHRTWSFGADVSDCDRYLIVSVQDGCETKSLVWIAPLEPTGPTTGSLVFDKVINEFVGEYSYLGNDGHLFYFTTTKDAPKKKIISLDLKTKEEKLIVPEDSSVLSFAALVGNKLILNYLEDVKDVVYITSLDAPATRLKLPLPIGTVEAISCHRKKTMVSIKMTSFLLPGRSYTFDIADPEGTLAIFRDDVPSSGFDPNHFTTTQIFYPSVDGTRIPMFVLHRSDVVLNGTNPLLVYGYGGFNISLTPSFSPSRIVFLNDMNGVVAIPNIRGGGEYGQDWHDAGRRKNKQNCFTDFIEAIKHLHANGYGAPATTAIMGGSNGGLLVAAVANQAPELMRSVVCQVGVLDMYKFHKFTIGHAWKSDYGNPDVEEDFLVVEKYSPLHNVRSGVEYPAILVVTGDHDDRVVPLHSHKYIAALQHANADVGGPFLARIEVAAGHGAGKPTSKRMQEAADTYAFLSKSLNVKLS